MKIVREEPGIKLEVELTKFEMYAAYLEYQHLLDKEDIEDYLEYVEDEEDVRQDALPLLDQIACRYRHYINKYDMDWHTARNEAIYDVLQEKTICDIFRKEE